MQEHIVPEYPKYQVDAGSEVPVLRALQRYGAVKQEFRLPRGVRTPRGQQAQGQAVVPEGEARTPGERNPGS